MNIVSRLFLVICFFSTNILALDWPQFLGPNRNGTVPGEIIPWGENGPSNVWNIPVGQGFSGPVVSSNKLVLFHRIGSEEILDCLDASSGSNVWRYAYITKYRDDFGFEEGPRATPAIENDVVYSYGADGMISAVHLQTGKKMWSVDARVIYGANKGFFGRACSPLIEGELLILNIGGRNGAGIIALDKRNGKLRWKATEDEASYSSPVTADISGVRQIVVLGRSALYGLNLDGDLLFEHIFKPGVSASVTASTPLVYSNMVFLTASYDAGALMLELGKGSKPTKQWGGDEILSSHYATPVVVDDYIYGFDGRQEYGPALTCVSWKDGKVAWRNERFGSGTITAVGSKLMVMMESGELIMANASADKFEELARHQILGSTVRAYPAFADGHFYARDKTKLVCLAIPLQPAEEKKEPEIAPEKPNDEKVEPTTPTGSVVDKAEQPKPEQP